MRLQHLSINNFRSLEDIEIDFQKDNLVLIGDNGSGKTSIIEALYYCCFLTSFRAKSLKELINFDEDITNINLNYNQDTNYHLSIGFNQKKIKIMLNSQEIKKKRELIGNLQTVLLNTNSINLVDLSPKIRRNFLDIYISQINREYLIKLQEFVKLSKIKREILKNGQEQTDQAYLEVVAEKYLKINEYLKEIRKNYLTKLEKEAERIYAYIAGSNDYLKLKYLEKKYVDLAEEQRYHRLSYGVTLDDFSIELNDINLKDYGSQGQKRTAAIALLLAQLSFFSVENPFIMVDDVHLELDENRQINLFSYFREQNVQIIYATTDLGKVPNIVRENSQIIKLHDGKIIKN